MSKPDPAHPFFISRGFELTDRPTSAVLLRRPEIHLEDLLKEGLYRFGRRIFDERILFRLRLRSSTRVT